MKKYLAICGIIACANILQAQTPFDNFDQTMATTPMLETEQKAKFVIPLTDSTGKQVVYLQLDADKRKLDCFNTKDSLVATLALNEEQIKFLSVDPLTKQYPFYSPYHFAGNTPIQAIDLDGLEPESVVSFNSSTGEFKFTKPAIHLLNLVTGVEKQFLENATLGTTSMLAYNPNKGGGAITFQNAIYFTPNYFSKVANEYGELKSTRIGSASVEIQGKVLTMATDLSKIYNTSYGINNTQGVHEWLQLSSHEVGHLPQAASYSNNFTYAADFAKNYFISFDSQLPGNPIGTDLLKRTHDYTLNEYLADKGRVNYDNFKAYTDKTYGKNSLPNLILNKAKNSDESINSTLDKWHNEYSKEQGSNNKGK